MSKPTIWVTDRAMDFMWACIDEVTTEIGGMGYAFREGRYIVVDEMFLVPQRVSGAEVLFTDPSWHIVKAYEDGVLERDDFMWVWWHSHANMNVYWSQTDDMDFIDNFRKSGGTSLLSIVGNRKHDYRCRLDLWDHPIVPEITLDELAVKREADPALMKLVDEGIAQFVRKSVHVEGRRTLKGGAKQIKVAGQWFPAENKGQEDAVLEWLASGYGGGIPFDLDGQDCLTAADWEREMDNLTGPGFTATDPQTGQTRREPALAEGREARALLESGEGVAEDCLGHVSVQIDSGELVNNVPVYNGDSMEDIEERAETLHGARGLTGDDEADEYASYAEFMALMEQAG